MPTYVYACPTCNAVAEDFLPMDDRDTLAPICGGDIILHGSEREPYMIEDGRPHVAAVMHIQVSRFTGIVRGGTRNRT